VMITTPSNNSPHSRLDENTAATGLSLRQNATLNRQLYRTG
jgi:hypothetical protein